MDEDDRYFILNEHLERKSAELKKRLIKPKKKIKIYTTNDIDVTKKDEEKNEEG